MDQIGSESLIDLNRALDDLGAIDAYKVQLVELRYFLGCTAEETAALTRFMHENFRVDSGGTRLRRCCGWQHESHSAVSCRDHWFVGVGWRGGFRAQGFPKRPHIPKIMLGRLIQCYPVEAPSVWATCRRWIETGTT